VVDRKHLIDRSEHAYTHPQPGELIHGLCVFDDIAFSLDEYIPDYLACHIFRYALLLDAGVDHFRFQACVFEFKRDGISFFS